MQVPRLKEIEVKLEIINKPGSYIQLAMKYRYQEHSFHSDLYYFRFKIYCLIWPRSCTSKLQLPGIEIQTKICVGSTG